MVDRPVAARLPGGSALQQRRVASPEAHRDARKRARTGRDAMEIAGLSKTAELRVAARPVRRRQVCELAARQPGPALRLAPRGGPGARMKRPVSLQPELTPHRLPESHPALEYWERAPHPARSQEQRDAQMVRRDVPYPGPLEHCQAQGRWVWRLQPGPQREPRVRRAQLQAQQQVWQQLEAQRALRASLLRRQLSRPSPLQQRPLRPPGSENVSAPVRRGSDRASSSASSSR